MTMFIKGVTEDAKLWATAKMAYGEGAGLFRRKVWAKIGDKMKDVQYAQRFEEELSKLNMADYAKLADFNHAKKETIEVLSKGFRFTKEVLAGLGISFAGIIVYYITHKKECDMVLKSVWNGIRQVFYSAKMGVRSWFSDLRAKLFGNKKVVTKVNKTKIFQIKDWRDKIDPNSLNRF